MKRVVGFESRLMTLRGVPCALALTLAFSGSVHAEPRPDSFVVVHVQNDAPVAGWLLRAAQQETTRVFRQFGVDLQWREPGVYHEGGQAPEVSVVLMSAEMGANKAREDHVRETTLATSSRRTGRSYVFCERISEVASRNALSETMVLSHTLTHELGHMVASIGHDAYGVMRESLELREAGFFGFTDAQKRAIRAALAAAAATDTPRIALRLAR